MKVAIIFNHPYEGSYCTAILNAIIAGLQRARHEADLLHLDRDNFNPVMTAQDLKAFVRIKHDHINSLAMLDPQVLDYAQRLQNADHLVFIFPIWWELMPARMKGFIDKVIFPGIAYDYANNGYGMVKRWTEVKSVTLITTMNTPGFLYRWLFGNAIRKAFFTGTFWKIGYPKRKWISLNRVKSVSAQQREKWLAGIEKRFAELK